jgi:3-hydroxyisobutyrate dehydrogenase-like beta-hydroxyacid dehydrogenase
MKVKLVNNLLFAAHTQLAAEAIRLAGDIGVEPAALTGALAHCSGMSAAIGHLAASGTTIEEFGRLAGPFLRKDVAACDRTAAELGADIGLLGVTARSGSLPLGS